MKILFTGASSFTGMHFVHAMLKAGHEVHCTFSRASLFDYSSHEQNRISTFLQHTHNRFSSPFGSPFFFEEFKGKFDVLCLHGTKGQSAGHDTSDFDVMGAVLDNTWHASSVMEAAKKAGVKKVVLTGTYFEKWGGMLHSRSNCQPAKNTYALSKTLTSDIIKFYCDEQDITFAKFIISNPFGPYENNRFTTQAAMTWLSGKHYTVLFPDPIRDNIHVSILAKCYAKFLMDNDDKILAPRGYQGSQGEFALKFAKEMKPRLGVPCPLDFAVSHKNTSGMADFRGNTTYPEEYLKQPDVIINGENYKPNEWSEATAWNALAEYYKSIHKVYSGRV